MQLGNAGTIRFRIAVMAAVLLFLVFAQASAEVLKPGSKGAEVTKIQEKLLEKGYYSKAVTAVYTTATKKAVSTFQVANSIKPSVAYGIADEKTQKAIYADDAVTYSDYVEKLSDEQLKPGGKGAYVKEAQKRLKELGYYTGSITGKYQGTTTSAVKLFQTANSLKTSGNADAATRAVLYSEAAITRKAYDEANYLTPLKIGAKGSQVTKLQEQLLAKGYYWGEPSGVFDAQTKYSVQFFQEANGLKKTSAADRTLRQLANAGSSVTFEKYTKNMQLLKLSSGSKGVKVALLQSQLKTLGYYTGVINGVYNASVVKAVKTFQTYNNMKSSLITGKANTETRKLLISASALSYSQVNGEDTLKSGDTGTAVSALQTRLNALGYYEGDASGTYDANVKAAVKLFQKYNGLSQTGIAYSNTLSVLDSSSAVAYTNAKIEKMIALAMDQLGDPYVYGAGGPDKFDCSGFTSFCLAKVGVKVTAEVRAQSVSLKKISKKTIKNYKELRRGDIVFFDTQDGKKPGHAGIFLETTKKKQYKYIHASSAKGKVLVSDLNTDYYVGEKGVFMYGVRLWE